ncbi:MAG: 50S ribosomal protein L24 [Acidobacteriota bacterium]|nr:50S ribosomal protein L24 [Acidobacteriota bacterium]
MEKLRIKKDDEVVVTRGRNRGAKGKVMRVQPDKGTAIVERVNMIKRHTRPNPQKQVKGGILEREAPIQLANLKLLCPECGKPTRVGRKRLENGSGVRVCKLCEATFN